MDQVTAVKYRPLKGDEKAKEREGGRERERATALAVENVDAISLRQGNTLYMSISE